MTILATLVKTLLDARNRDPVQTSLLKKEGSASRVKLCKAQGSSGLRKMRSRFANAPVALFAPLLFLLASSSPANFLSLVGGVSTERFRFTILTAKPSDGKRASLDIVQFEKS